MRVRFISRSIFLCASLFSFVVLSRTAQAQADDTAKRPADLLLFAGYGYTMPDYGDGHNNGITFGADYDRSFGWRVIPGLEVRGNINSGSITSEHSYLFGPRAHVNLKRRYHPYANFLVGLGQVTYPEFGSTVHDSGLVYSIGGGVDIDVAHNLMFKADIQSASWNMGPNSFTKPQGGDFTLSPATVTIGVTYRIPFHKWVDQKHSHE